ncbi:MAG TPA: FlgD immunoglobulin-like domain containing protein [Candidatus Cloacimonadota bacterium]|nr:FlgD immunoglobulin-like domain containing protein [Candidatus Cloacimonadota bacterium]HPT70774.1 FlgD immunoglobulin-like domain containing protein [Candidatus Cloacimonadota bacterium]
MRNTTIILSLMICLSPFFCWGVYHQTSIIPGTYHAGSIQNNLAYLSAGTNFPVSLDIYDISNEQNPSLLSSMNLSGINQIAVRDSVLFATASTENGHLYIVNVSNPSQPQLVSNTNFDFDQDMANLLVYDHYIFSTFQNNLQIFNIANLSQPVHITSFPLGDSTMTIGKIQTSEHYLYCTTNHNFQVYDISFPPIPLLDDAIDTEFRNQVVIGNGAAFLSGYYSFSDDIDIIKITDPCHLQHIGTIPSPGQFMYYANDHLYAASIQQISDYDVSNPYLLNFVSYYDTGWYRIIDAEGGNLYLLSTLGVQKLNFQNPNNPYLVGSYHLPMFASSIEFGDTNAIVWSHIFNQIINIADPSQIYSSGQLTLPEWAFPIKLIGHYAYMIDQTDSTIYVYDISDPQVPLMTSSLHVPLMNDVQDMEIDGNYAYLQSSNKITVLDIHVISDPQVIGGIEVTDHTMIGLKIHNGIAYAVTDIGGVIAYHISNASDFNLISSFINPVEQIDIRGFEISGNVGYLAAREEGIQVLDLSDPTNITLLQTIQMSSNESITPIAIASHYLFFGDNSRNTIYTYDITIPTQPVYVASFPWNCRASKLVSHGNLLYATNGRSIEVLSFPWLTANHDDMQTKTLLDSNNYPNPFNPETTITFSIPRQTDVKLEIYNIRGQRVKTLVSGFISRGSHQVKWDGKDQKGNSMGSGVYFYRITTPEGKVTKKMLLLK